METGKKVFVFQFHVTDVCLNKCLHCYVEGMQRTTMSKELAFKIIDDIKSCCEQLDMGTLISVTGGDPFLHPSIWEILRKAKSIGCQLDILGNPELVTEDIVEKLKDIGVGKYQLSLDGMQATHDKIRGEGSFERTTKAIRLMSKMKLPVSVMSTVSDLNYSEMVDVMKHSYENGAARWSFARYTPDTGDCGISAAEFNDFLKDIIREHAPFTKMGKVLPIKETLMAPLVFQPMESSCIIGGCALGSSMLCILPDATVMPCRRLRESVLGKWDKENDLINYFLFSPKMEEYRNIELIEGCNACKFLNRCRGCRAAALAATGNIFGKDPQCFMHG